MAWYIAHTESDPGSDDLYTASNIGIGTTSPGAKLDIRASTGARAIDMFADSQGRGFRLLGSDFNNATNQGSALYVDFFEGTGDTNAAIAGYKSGTSVHGDIILNPSGGSVGIGVTNPQAKLHVNGDFITKGPWVDVRAFGAKGDDSTDDTDAIQDAIDYLVENGKGGTVFFPYGTYKVTDRIMIGNGSGGSRCGDGITLRGVNSRVSSLKIYNRTTNKEGVILVQGGIPVQSRYFSRWVDVIGLGFDIENHADNDNRHTAIFIEYGVFCRIKDCRIEGQRLSDGPPATYSRWKCGIKVVHWMNAIIDCYLSYCNEYCINLQASNSSGAAPNNTVVTRCFIEKFSGYGINVCGDTEQRAGAVVIDGNTIQAGVYEQSSSSKAIFLNEHTHNTLITGNFFEYNYDVDIEIQSKFNTVIGNSFWWSAGRSSQRIVISSGKERGNVLLGNTFHRMGDDEARQIDVINGSRVGIGTSDPQDALHVKGSTSVLPPVFTGSGTNDMETGGPFTGDTTDVSYRVQIDGTGTPDTFKWSDDGGSTWDATGVQMTGSEQTLNNGVTVKFAETTGHTLNDRWDFTAVVNHPLRLVTRTGGELLIARNDGRIGLGTTSPGTIDEQQLKLDVNGYAGFNGLRVGQDGYNDILTENDSGLAITSKSTNSNATIDFKTGGTENSNIRMSIKKGGAIGIGTTTIYSGFHISKDAGGTDKGYITLESLSVDGDGSPSNNGEMTIYAKGNKIVLAMKVSGTVRYTSIDMSANGNSWSQTTTVAP